MTQGAARCSVPTVDRIPVAFLLPAIVSTAEEEWRR
jgi:hypothetical protein